MFKVFPAGVRSKGLILHAVAILKLVQLAPDAVCPTSTFRIAGLAQATALPASLWMTISDGREFSVAASRAEMSQEGHRKQTMGRLRQGIHHQPERSIVPIRRAAAETMRTGQRTSRGPTSVPVVWYDRPCPKELRSGREA